VYSVPGMLDLTCLFQIHGLRAAARDTATPRRPRNPLRSHRERRCRARRFHRRSSSRCMRETPAPRS
jgi:hypothetical protein